MKLARMLPLVALAATGCSLFTSPANSLVVEATLRNSSIIAGHEAAFIDLTITNRGDRAIDVMLDECHPPFVVMNLQRRTVGPASGDRPACYVLVLIAPTTIEPGASVHYTSQWFGDASGIGPRDERLYVSPGQYLIQPRVSVAGTNDHVNGGPLPIAVEASPE